MSLPLAHPLPLPLASVHHASPLASPISQEVASLQQHTHSATPSATPGRRLSSVLPQSGTASSSPTRDLPPTRADDLDHADGDSDDSYLPPPPLNLARIAPAVVPSRQGSVLSRGLILKADYRFSAAPPDSASAPSSSSSSSGAPSTSTGPGAAPPAGHSYGDVSGASHVREGGLGIWGVAQPTATGVRSLLALLGAKGTPGTKGKAQGKKRDVAWFVTREEPILYIGGQPYVLREAARALPFPLCLMG